MTLELLERDHVLATVMPGRPGQPGDPGDEQDSPDGEDETEGDPS